MANPFPGMDPYLEGPEWTSVHTDLTAEIARQLAPKVRPKYAVRSERRVVMVAPDPTELPRERFPDVAIVEARPHSGPNNNAAVAAPLVVDALLPVPVEQTTVEVWDVQGQRLVTAIEVLSPTNKRGAGRREYERKREKLRNSTVHLLEIDLIRVGRRFPIARRLPRAPYFVFLSRADRREKVEVWPIQLDQPLPTVAVPLLPDDPDVQLDLQTALTTIYDIFAYDQTIDYREPPPGRLPRAAASWLDEQLRAARRRP